MTYRELLTLYKTGKLDNDQRTKVEEDIEKQDAISEYLYENSTIPGFDEIETFHDADNNQDAGYTVESGKESMDSAGEQRFTAMVQNSIRRAFIKTGIIVGIIVLLVVLGTIFVVPKLVSAFYYNPNEVVGIDEESQITTNRMSLDLSVYSEVFMPESFRNDVIAEAEGYGEYSITIPQHATFTKTFTTVNGRLERGKLTLYNADIMVRPTSNAYVFPDNVKGQRSSYSYDDEISDEVMGASGTKSYAYSQIAKFDENEWYEAYVSLKDITNYEPFYKWVDKFSYNNLWCAVYMESKEGYILKENMGFMPTPSGYLLDWDRKTYPNLSLLDNKDNEKPLDDSDTKLMQTHFISMLTYLRDNNEIVKIMGDDEIDYDSMIDSVKRDGLRLYGFAIQAQKETILELTRDPAVSYIYTKQIN